MNVLMIVLRVVHIFSGVFWVGVSFFNLGFLQPTVQSTGDEGHKVMQHLTAHTRFEVTAYSAATLSLLSGWLMYWNLFGFRLSVLSSGYGLILTIGAIAGTIAWVIAIVFIRKVLGRMESVGRAIEEQGHPPTPEQASELQASGAQLVRLGQWGVGFMVVALLGMSAAQYVSL
jgi:uncharacterized membrane protein